MVSPLLLRSFGRSGSTAMMQLLGTSPNILFSRVYPFETRMLAYVLRAARLVAAPVDRGADWNQDVLLRRDPTRIGPPPFEISPPLQPGFQEALSTSMVRVFFDKLDQKGADTQRPTYYAEKIPLDLVPVINGLFPETRNVILLRDPRDEFVSIRAFNEKRNALAFDWREGESAADFARRLVKMRRGLLSNFPKMHRSKRDFPLRYEELMQDGGRIAKELGEWLGLELSWSKVVEAQPSFAHHMTTDGGASSVARWKQELEPELRAIFEDELGPQLHAAGYDV